MGGEGRDGKKGTRNTRDHPSIGGIEIEEKKQQQKQQRIVNRAGTTRIGGDDGVN